MIIFIIGFIFIIGLFIGSFLNVLIDRLPLEKNPWKGRSKCDFCNHSLSPLDLIPIFSFIILGGKCKYCHKKLSFQYPLIEILTGIMYVSIFVNISKLSNVLNPFDFAQGIKLTVLNLPVLLSYLSLLVIFSSFLVIFVADVKYQIIPDEMLVSLGVGVLLMLVSKIPAFAGMTIRGEDSSLAFGMTTGMFRIAIPYLLSGLTTGLFFLTIYLVTKRKGMGFGDVKLAPLLGLFLGFPKIIVSLYIAFLTGAIFSIILIILGKKEWKSKIAFGPFLIIGASLSYFIGDLITKWYMNFFL